MLFKPCWEIGFSQAGNDGFLKPTKLESKEVIGGYWIIQTKSKEEAVEWARRVPAAEGDVIEIRQIFEMCDFPEDVKKAADNRTVMEQIKR